MRREYPDLPIVGVGAVILREDKVLLIQRGNEPAKGKWAIPGGVLNLGEELRKGVAREIREECQIEIEVRDIIDVLDSIFWDDTGRIQYHYVLCDFLATYLTGNVRPSSDVLDARWFTLNEILTLNTTSGTQQVVKRAFEKIGRLK